MVDTNALSELIFDNRSYKEIYELKDQGKLDYDFVTIMEKSFIIMDKNEKNYLFFQNPISITFQNIYINQKIQEYIINNIYSSIQIENYFVTLNISNPLVILKETKKNYWDAKINIDPFIENNKLIIYNDTSSFAEFVMDKDIDLIKDNKFNPKNLSKFFFKYFAYNDENDKSEFEYDDTKRRKSFVNNFLNVLIYKNDIHFFKFCGPSSTGKSTTLLKFSRENKRIIYLNLKLINTLEKENNFDYYNLIIYEFRKLSFETQEKKDKFTLMLKNECQNKSSVIIILNILNEIKNEKYIIIFDQFKEKYIQKTNFEEIEKLIKTSKLKLIICSSINDKDIRNEVIKTIEYFGGNPKELEQISQYFYFYICQNFFEKKTCDNPELNELFQLFEYKPKYKHLLKASNDRFNVLNGIKLHVISKIKEFFSFEQDFDLCKILLNIKNKINLKFEYSEFSNIVKKVPLKYYNLKLEGNYFGIDYAFNYMKYIEKDNITKEECMNYFLNKKYEMDKSLDGKVKGEYFEMSAKFFIEFNNVLPAKIEHKIIVKNIVGVEILKNDENTLGKIMYNSKYEIPKMEIKSKKKENEEIALIEKLLEKDNIKDKIMLNKKYENIKNINYYLINQALTIKEIYSKKNINEKKEINEIKNDENELLKNKRKRNRNEEKEKKEVAQKEIIINEVSHKEKKEFQKKVVPQKETKTKKETKKKKIQKIEVLNKEELKRKESYYIKDVDNNGILINQEDANGMTLDQAFIYGDKDNKKLLGLQMKCLSDRVSQYNTLQNINKENIKQNCQTILLRSKLDLNVEIKEWHYIIIAYYNPEEKDNIYCKQLECHCKQNDLEIFYFNPEKQKLYNNKFKEIKSIYTSNRSNLDYDFPESNPFNIIYDNETNDLINSYYKERINKLNTNNYYDEKSIMQFSEGWLNIMNKKFNDIEKDLKETCSINKLRLIDYLKLDNNFMIPTPNKGYIFLFKDKSKTNLICYYNKNKLYAKKLSDKKDIKILELPIYIDTKENHFLVFKF